MAEIEVVSDREAYEEFISDNSGDVPLYAYPWWLDIVANGAWQPYCLRQAGEVLAVVPLFSPIRKVTLIPPYTQTGGIVYASSLSSTEGRGYYRFMVHRRQLLEAFLEAVPNQRFYKVSFSPEFTDWLPLYWRGYRSSLRYTYRLPLISAEELRAQESRHIHQKIATAEKKGWLYREHIPTEELMNQLSLLYQRKKLPTERLPLLRRLVDLSMRHNSGLVAGVYTGEGELLSAAFVPYVGGKGYLIATAMNPAVRAPESGGYLIHNILLTLMERGVRLFDFEGSMLQGVEFVFRSFGAVQTPLIELSKGNLNWWQRWQLKRYYSRSLSRGENG